MEKAGESTVITPEMMAKLQTAAERAMKGIRRPALGDALSGKEARDGRGT